MDKFLEYINKYISINETIRESLIANAKIEEFKKGAQILSEGNSCKRLYFLSAGSVRTYFYKEDKEITHWIYVEGGLFTSWHSYLSEVPAKENIEAISDIEVISISRERWLNLFDEHPELHEFYRLMLEFHMTVLDDFSKGYYFMSAKEKYELLVAYFPEVLQNANLGHIASMLGITQETLSRIRAKK